MGKALPVEVRKQKFIELAKSIHGNKYDYSKVNYTKNNEYVTITCKIHGDFQMKPMVHTGSKSGCRECFNDRRHTIRAKGVDFYVNLAREVHGDRYDYSNVSFSSCREKVEIICKDHGAFYQTMDNHTHGKKGCPTCGNISSGAKQSLTYNEWLSRFKEAHGDEFTYPESFEATNQNCLIDIKCRVHGVFKQSLSSHSRGTKCPKCQLTFQGGFRSKSADRGGYSNIYLISFIYGGRLIHKVGVTNDFNKRFSLLKSEIDVDPVLIYYKEAHTAKCLEIEKELSTRYKYNRAVFDAKFGGYTECLLLTNEQVLEIKEVISTYFN